MRHWFYGSAGAVDSVALFCGRFIITRYQVVFLTVVSVSPSAGWANTALVIVPKPRMVQQGQSHLSRGSVDAELFFLAQQVRRRVIFEHVLFAGRVVVYDGAVVD